jgi:carbonic anhydrase/acetyltransferase-like protein (isoleucine patch superfamily)
MPAKVFIGKNVSIGAGCTIYSAHIEDDVVIGDKSVILEGARLEKGCQVLPGSVVPPGRLIPTKQLWGGNPVQFIKDLNVGEVWANYTKSYVNAAQGGAHRHEFTTWNSAYLSRPSNQEDLAPNEGDLRNAYIDRDYYAGFAKYYL